jgi:hypothetical protein
MTTKSFLSPEERAVLEIICGEEQVSPQLVERLIDVEDAVFGMGRRHLIWEQIDALIRDFAESDNQTRHNEGEDEP